MLDLWKICNYLCGHSGPVCAERGERDFCKLRQQVPKTGSNHGPHSFTAFSADSGLYFQIPKDKVGLEGPNFPNFCHSKAKKAAKHLQSGRVVELQRIRAACKFHAICDPPCRVNLLKRPCGVSIVAEKNNSLPVELYYFNLFSSFPRLF